MRKFLSDILVKASLGVEQNAYVLGTVGIGTSSPGAKLHLSGSGVTELRIASTTGNTNSLLSFYESTLASWGIDAGQANGSFFIKDLYNSATRLTINYVGNVGIGTTSPSLESGGVGLDILNSSYTQLRVRSSSSSAGIEMTPGAGKRWEIQANTSSNWFVYDRTDQLYRLLINGDGYVGIGTTSPIYQFDITTANYKSFRIQSSDDALITIGSTVASSQFYSIGASGIGSGQGSNLFWIGRSTNNPSGFLTKDFVINSSGNVGIGTTSPVSKLTVTNGNIEIQSDGSSSMTNYLKIGTHTGGSWGSYISASSFYNSNLNTNLRLGVSNSGTLIDVISITSVGDVGIGTASPASLLHIYSTSNSPQGITIQGGDESFVKFLQGSGGVKNWGLITTNLAAGDFGIYQSTSTGGDPFSAGTAKLYFNNDGNVGIGTTSPTDLLSLSGAQNGLSINSQTTGDSYIRFRKDGVISTDMYVDRATENFFIGPSVSSALILKTNATERMRITSGGNVGIGTTSPGATLSVLGGGGSALGSNDITASFTRATVGENCYLAIDTTSANRDSGIRFGDGGTLRWTLLSYKSSSPDGFGFFNHSTSAFEMFLNDNGNVGIGTASPGLKLDVVSGTTLYPVLRLQNTDVNGYSGAHLYSSAGTLTGHFGWANGSSTTLSDKMYFGTIANKPVVFTTNDSEKMRITPGGSLLIGDTTQGYSPTSQGYLLGVKSNTTQAFISIAKSGQTLDTNGMIVGLDSTAGYVYLRENIDLAFGTNNTTQVTIKNNGNVGIGTTSPAYKLDVATGNDNAIRILNSSGNNNNGLALSVGSGTPWLDFYGGRFDIKYNTSPGSWNSGANTFLSILSSGNVGIGTTSPSQKLDVSGVTSTQGLYIPGLYTFGQASSGIEMQLTSASYNAIRFFQGSDWTGVIHSFGRSWAGGVSVGMVNIEGYNGVTIGAWNIPTATFLSSGNVGIGTTSPSDKLQVVASTYNGITITTPDVATFKMRSSSGATSWGFATTNLAANDFGIYQSNSSGGDPINAGTARLYFNGSGNVGIGTATPGYKLDVSGIINTTSAPGSYGTIIRVRDTVTGGTESFGGVHFTSSPGTDYTIGKWTTAAGAGLLQIRDQAGNQFVTINSSGNVGIGTTSPSDKLQVQNGNLSLYSNSYGNTGLIRHFGTDSLEKYQQGLTTGGDFYQYTFSGLNHIFYTNNGNERMRITSGGNILMNTVATPTTGGFTNTTLSVKQVADGLYGGGLHIEENATTSVAYFGFNGSVFNIGTSYRTTGNYRPIAFSTNGSERLRIDNAGNVGIGTTSPTYKLQLENGSQYIVGGLGAINSSPYTSANRLIFNNDYNDIARGPNKITLYDGSWLGGFGIHNNTMAYYSGGVHEWYLATNASNPASLMTLLANGNLGIGISPATRLNIYGVDPIFRMSTADNSMDIKYTTSGGGAAQRISIGAGASTEHLVVLNSGNVGIGTTSPSYKLHVEGTIYSPVYTSGSITINSGDFLFAADGGGDGFQMDYYNGQMYIGNNAGTSWHMVMQDNGNVGIGTTSPAYKLEVSGTIYSVNSGTDGGQIRVQNSGGGNAWYWAARTTGLNLGQLGVADGRIFIDNNGNVGIGTANPTLGKLQVEGDGIVINTEGTTAAKYLYFRYSNGGDLRSDSFLTFSTGGSPSEKMRIMDGGNVGIGTTSPSGKLSIVTSGTNDLLYLNSGVNTDFAYKIVSGSDDAFVLRRQHTTQGDLSIMSWTYSGKVGIGTTSPTGKLTISQNNSGGVAALTFTEDESTIQGPSANTKILMGGNLSLNAASTWIAGTNGSERMRISSGGNVGIGTTSPAQKLDVFGAIQARPLANGSSGNYWYMIGSITDVTNFGVANGIVVESAGLNSYAMTFGTQTTYLTGITEKMRITSGGNVGIGTTSPGAKLHIGENGSAAQLWLQRTDGYNPVKLIGGTLADGNGFKITMNTTDAFSITSGGNVGIGTTSPLSPLHQVGGGGNYTGEARFGGSSTAFGIELKYTQAGSTLGSIYTSPTYSSTDILFKLGAGLGNENQLVLKGNGNVGIGTTSPADTLSYGKALDIQSSTGAAIYLRDSDATSVYGLFAYDGGGINRTNIGGIGANNYVRIISAGNEAIRIDASGNVGIGTTSPSGKLAIKSPGEVSSYGDGFVLERNANSAKLIRIYESGADGYLEVRTGNNDIVSKLSGYSGTPSYFLSNVGIGTSSPSEKLAVAGRITLSGSEFSFSGDEDKNITVFSNRLLNLRTNDITRLTITGSGNVGIGTTSPVTGLDVRTSPYSNTTARFGTARPVYIINDDPIIGFNQYYNSGWKAGTTGYSGNVGVSSAGEMYFNVSTSSVVTDNIVTQREVMRILNNGNVGIGTASPSYNLHVEGNTSGISIYASHDIAAFSDITVKKEVKRIENAIEKVKELNGYTYVRTDDETGTRRAGVIAQEVQKVLPEVVSANPDGTLNVAYSNMIALLIEGMKEQQKEIDELKKLLKK